MSRKPTAHIAVNKNRIKTYNGKIYLKNNTEFQIELDNPTPHKVLVEISFNNKKEQSNLILKPGQRVYLDRFIDSDKKLLFETYKVPTKNLKATKQAGNGKIKIQFFKEMFSPAVVDHWQTWPRYFYSFDTANKEWYSSPAINITCKDTGRVEEGDVSNQHFMSTSGVFEAREMATYDLQILPESDRKTTEQLVRKYCTDCGAKVQKRFKFCAHCGVKL